MTEPTDNMIAEVVIEACEAGHVHIALVETGDGCHGLHGIFTPEEAYDLAVLLMRCAAEADSMLRDTHGEPGPCTLH
jgi:hypothetical protein